MSNILIIEDHNEINQILTDLLKEEHQIFSAFSGTEGLLVFEKETIDLVLLDIMLPGKSGDQVLTEIRQSSQVPIIILTALSEKKRISEYLLNGANDYITKPFDLEEVYARVLVQLRTVQPKQETRLAHKKIVLDLTDFTLRSAQKEVRLGRKEFELFKLLLENPKQIFTKEQLYERVWQELYIPSDNTLNTQLSNLRKKIAQLDSENEYVETIWGLGVRLAGGNQ
ncbi:response regulator transcription factor [Enterococcus olivae]